MKNSTIIFIVLSIALVLSSCIGPKKIALPKSAVSTLADSIDQKNPVAIANWKSFYKDSILVSLIDTALKSNQDLLVALQKIEVGKAETERAAAQLFPNVSANVAGGMRRFGLYTMDGAGNISTEITPGQIVPIHLPDMLVGFTSSWEADISGKLKNQKKSALTRFLASIDATQFIQVNLIAEIASSYFELIALDNIQLILEQTRARQQSSLNIITEQKNAGRANELAVQQFKAELISIQLSVMENQQRILELENKINFLIGRPQQRIDRNLGELDNTSFSEINVNDPLSYLKNRPDVRAAEKELLATQFDYQIARRALIPNLMISSSFGYQAFNPNYLFITPSSIAYTALGSLVMPLINLRSIKADLKNASASQIQAFHEYNKTVLNALVEINNEKSRLEYLNSATELLKTQNDLLYSSIEISNDLYSAAKANYLEVLFAQQNLLDSQLLQTELKKERKVCEVNLFKALGGG